MQLAIKEVEQKILELSSCINEMLLGGMAALMTKDITLAQEIIEKNKYLDVLQIKLDGMCAQAIAMKQPVGTDLRYFIGGIKLSTSLVDIGGYIRHMCIYVNNLETCSFYYLLDKHVTLIQGMLEMCSRMLKSSIDAFITQDKDVARETARLDTNIDSIYFKLYKEVVSDTSLKNKDVESVFIFLGVIQIIERIGNVLVHINGHVVYVSIGEYVDLS